MKIISVVNYKGGVGKTTFVANLAAKLANEGKRVLLIDLDPQESLTFSFIHVEEWNKKYKDTKTIKNWFDDKLNNKNTNIKDYIVKDLDINKGYTCNEPISLICSHFDLVDISLEMALAIRGVTKRSFDRNNMDCLFMLKKGLEDVKGKYDFVFLDCQPSFDLITRNAIVASDYYLIPTKFDYLSTLGIDSLINHIEGLVEHIDEKSKKFNFKGYNLNPKLLGVVGNMVTVVNKDNLTAFNKNVEAKLSDEKYKLFKHRIRNNSEFMDMIELIPAVAKKADNKTRKDIVKEIEDLTLEFEERVYGR